MKKPAIICLIIVWWCVGFSGFMVDVKMKKINIHYVDIPLVIFCGASGPVPWIVVVFNWQKQRLGESRVLFKFDGKE